MKITQSDNRIAFLLFAITFLLKVSYSLFSYYSHDLPATNLYFELAQQIISQGKILYETSNPYYEFPGPVLPWINALTMIVFGKNYLGLFLVTAFAAALITPITYKTARIFLDKPIALFAGLWSCFYVFYFFYSPTPGKDIWMSLLLIALVYLFLKIFIQNQFNYSLYIGFIVLFAISFHLDERFFIFSPFLFFYILFTETKIFSRFKIEKSLIFATLLILLMIPWSIRNYNKHGKVVILSTRTEVFTDKLFGYESRGHMMDKYNDVHGAFYIHDYQIDSVINGTKTITDGGWKINQKQIEAMKQGKLPKPLTGFKAYWSRTVTMLEPFQIQGRYERTGYFYYKKSFRHNIADFFSYGLIFIFCFPGFYFLYLKNKKIFYLFLSVIFIYLLTNILAIPYSNWRYRLPLDALFIIIGCYGIASVYSGLIKSNSKK